MRRDVRIIGLMGVLGMLCRSSFAQSVPALDPFIGAVDAMKRSVAYVSCVVQNGVEAKIIERMGSAFFISSAGDFLTAAHVLVDIRKHEPPCPIAAITVPLDSWRPEARSEALMSLPFKASGCRIDSDSDVAACRLNEDPAVRSLLISKIAPVKFEWSLPPDGTQIAFTGFPANARDPMTVRADVAAYRTVWETEKALSEVVLDHAAWPGSSGSPVYLSDGRVIAILIAGGRDEATGMTIARPVSLVREWLAETQ